MLNDIRIALKKRNIIWRQHAFARMLERDISREDVSNVIRPGEIIESYPEAKPYPSFLIADISGNRRVHVVAAWDESRHTVYIITVYIPDNEHFEENGVTRKEKG